MEKTIVKSGLIFKNELEFDDKSLSSVRRTFRLFPFALEGAKLRYVGFIKKEKNTYPYDENMRFWVNTNILSRRKTLYISYSDRYDTLPTTEEDMVSDDRDDLTISMWLEDKGLKEAAEGPSKSEDKDYDADLYMRTETFPLRIGKENREKLCNLMRAAGVKELEAHKVGGCIKSLFAQECLTYDETWAFYCKPKMISGVEVDSTPIPYMAFFLRSKPIFSKGGVYCGYHRQINIEKIAGNIASDFHEHCKKYAPRLTDSGEDFKSSILANPFNLWRWIHPDRISLTKEAIIYTRKTWRKEEMTYLPYERAKVYLKGTGWFFKRFEIVGEQNIIPKYSFGASNAGKIEKILKSKGLACKTGRTYKSRSMFNPMNWFASNPRLTVIGDQYVYYPRNLEKKLEKSNGKLLKIVILENSEISKVTWHKHFFTWYGDVEIEGTPHNIRADQSTSKVRMVMPGMLMFKFKYFFFFSGSLRDFLKHSSAEFERKYSRWKNK